MKRRGRAWWRQLVDAVRLRLPLREQRGQAMVEFALVATPLLIILFGMVELGIAWNRKNDAVHLANEAVRMAAVNTTGNTICAKIKDELTANGVTLTGIQLVITAGVVGLPVTANVNNIPIVNSVPKLIPGMPNNVSGSASMRTEQASPGYGPKNVSTC